MAEADQNTNDTANDNATQEEGSKKRLIILIALGSLLVIGIGVGAAVFLSGGKATTDIEVDAADTRLEVASGEPEQIPAAEASADTAKAGSSNTQAGSNQARPAEGSVSDLGIDFGDTYKMKTFHLNLGNALENRYVRLEVTLEYSGGEEQKREIEKRMPQLRDAVISIVSRKTREFILAPDGKDAIRKEILIRINRYMKTKIDAVYITDILIE